MQTYTAVCWNGTTKLISAWTNVEAWNIAYNEFGGELKEIY